MRRIVVVVVVGVVSAVGLGAAAAWWGLTSYAASQVDSYEQAWQDWRQIDQHRLLSAGQPGDIFTAGGDDAKEALGLQKRACSDLDEAADRIDAAVVALPQPPSHRLNALDSRVDEVRALAEHRRSVVESYADAVKPLVTQWIVDCQWAVDADVVTLNEARNKIIDAYAKLYAGRGVTSYLVDGYTYCEEVCLPSDADDAKRWMELFEKDETLRDGFVTDHLGDDCAATSMASICTEATRRSKELHATVVACVEAYRASGSLSGATESACLAADNPPDTAIWSLALTDLDSSRSVAKAADESSAWGQLNALLDAISVQEARKLDQKQGKALRDLAPPTAI